MFESLDDATQRKKRKKLCDANTRRVFEALLSSCNATLGSYVETRSPDAYLCYTCDGKADKLHKKETEVEKLKRELLDKLCTLTLYTETEIRTQTRKRPDPGTHSGQTQKQRRVNSMCVPIPSVSSLSSAGIQFAGIGSYPEDNVAPINLNTALSATQLQMISSDTNILIDAPAGSNPIDLGPPSAPYSSTRQPQLISSANTPNSSIHQMDTNDSPEVAVN